MQPFFTVSVIIPVYNSQDTLTLLTERLAEVLPRLCQQFEVIFVNDGSRDKSWSVIETLASHYEFIRGIDLLRNYGQHNALLCGIRKAKYTIVITMDDDLQHPPEEIHHLLQKLNEGYDVVYGSAQKREHGLFRNWTTRITRRALQTIMGIEIAQNVSAFRTFRTSIRDAFATYNSPDVIIDVLLSWGTTHFAYVKVRHDPRHAGESNYTLAKLIRFTINIITGFSVLPLQFASLLGLGFTIVGAVLFLYVLASYIIRGGSIPGFPFIATTVTLFSGVELLVIGIIGEYLARLYQRSFGKPSYVIRESKETQ